MSKFWIEQVTDNANNLYWILFEHGQFHHPTAVIDDVEMKGIARMVLGVDEMGIPAPAEISKRLESYRNRHNCTLRDLAELTGISASTLSRIENGKEAIEYDTYTKLMAVLNPDW
jgi:DNA-binding XRE family transcriptional regulator